MLSCSRPNWSHAAEAQQPLEALRRTNASLSRKANIDDKVSADQRGHGLGVSLAVYAQSDLEQKIAAVGRLEAEVLENSPASDLGPDRRVN